MSKSAPTFAINDRVHSAVYGAGTISHLDSQYTMIQFDEHGSKKFLTSMVKLERSSVPAPAKPVRAKTAKPKVAKPKTKKAAK